MLGGAGSGLPGYDGTQGNLTIGAPPAVAVGSLVALALAFPLRELVTLRVGAWALAVARVATPRARVRRDLVFMTMESAERLRVVGK